MPEHFATCPALYRKVEVVEQPLRAVEGASDQAISLVLEWGCFRTGRGRSAVCNFPISRQLDFELMV